MAILSEMINFMALAVDTVAQSKKFYTMMTVIQKSLKRSWAFSNLVSFCKIHLFNYIHLINFLENPDRDWQKSFINTEQLALF